MAAYFQVICRYISIIISWPYNCSVTSNPILAAVRVVFTNGVHILITSHLGGRGGLYILGIFSINKQVYTYIQGVPKMITTFSSLQSCKKLLFFTATWICSYRNFPWQCDREGSNLPNWSFNSTISLENQAVFIGTI